MAMHRAALPANGDYARLRDKNCAARRRNNAINREVARDLLEIVRHADNACPRMACQALQILHDQSFDFVLMDVQMPIMNGIEVAITTLRVGMRVSPI